MGFVLKIVWLIFISFVLWTNSDEIKDYSLLDELLKLSFPPVLQYSWEDGANEELTKELVRDFLRCGFNGIQNKCSPDGAKYFPFGYLPTFYGTGKIPYSYRDKDGKIKIKPTAFGDICAEENVNSFVEKIEETIKIYGDSLFKLGKYYFMMTGDEVDMQYGKTAFKEVSSYREKLWQEYIKNYYGDESPEKDTNGDGRTYNKESITPVDSWEKISLPLFENRFKEPIIWDIYRDFHSFVFYNFFRKVEKKCEEKGIPVLLGMNGHGSISFPGGPATCGGASFWYQANMDRFFVNESVHTNWPSARQLHFSILNRLTCEYKKPIFVWSWFWPGWHGRSGICKMASEDEIERFFAQVFGNEVHCLLYWVYTPMFQRNFPEMEKIAFWHHWFQKHWDFLKKSHPIEPEVAILYPSHTGKFYGNFQYPKHNYRFFPQAFLDLHIPFTVLTEEEVEKKGIGNYKILFVISAERISQKTEEEIKKFIDRGGFVFVDGDSLVMDISGKPLKILEEKFGVKLIKKYKTWFNPSILSLEEEKWVEAKNKGEKIELPSYTPYGIKQVEFDTEKENIIEMKIPWIVPYLNTYNEVVTGIPTEKGKVLAEFNGEAVIIETDKTLWSGFHIGSDICATFPRQRLIDGSEPVAPWWKNSFNSAYQRAGYVDIIDYMCKKAGIVKPVEVFRNGQIARNINVYTRIHKETGTVLIILVDFDIEIKGAPNKYLIETSLAKENFIAWDLSENKQLQWKEKNKIEIIIPEHRTKYIVIGPPQQIKKLADTQKELLNMNLKPEPFRTGPRGGQKEPPLPSVYISGVSVEENLPENILTRMKVKITNTEEKEKLCEPIIIKGSFLSGIVPLGKVRSVKIENHLVQWDDLDKDGYFSSSDEIVWQATLPGKKTIYFIVDFLSFEVKEKEDKNKFFINKKEEGSLEIILDGKKIFGLNQYGEWDFENAELLNGSKIDIGEQKGFVFEVSDKELELKNIEIVSDGPVRKLLKVIFSSEELGITSTTNFAIYRNQLPDENRIYAYAVHSIDKEFNFPKTRLTDSYFYSPTSGGLLILGKCKKYSRPGQLKDIKCYYEDSLGRLSTSPSAYLENNFGGWISLLYPSGFLLQVSLKRVKGILEGKNILDETDGLQVGNHIAFNPYKLMRAAVNQKPENPLKIIDTKIEEGTLWKLDTLISVRKGFDEKRCRETRKSFANPPVIEIEKIVKNVNFE